MNSKTKRSQNKRFGYEGLWGYGIFDGFLNRKGNSKNVNDFKIIKADPFLILDGIFPQESRISKLPTVPSRSDEGRGLFDKISHFHFAQFLLINSL